MCWLPLFTARSSPTVDISIRFNNPDKGSVTHSLVHRALWEYLAALNDVAEEAERDKLRREIFERFDIYRSAVAREILKLILPSSVAKMSLRRWYTQKMEAVSYESSLL